MNNVILRATGAARRHQERTDPRRNERGAGAQRGEMCQERSPNRDDDTAIKQFPAPL